jgi:RNA polymerase sigma-B factor
MAERRLADRDTEELLAEFARTGSRSIREEIIERHEPLVRTLAHKFVRVGVAVDDLRQTAWLALIRAVDRFDPTHEAKFSTYATHCMVGEIKRYFRDRTWSMKVPRYLQELTARLPRTQDELVAQLGREPSMTEMASALGISEETLAEAMELQQSYQLPSLEDRCAAAEGGEGFSISDTVGGEDPRLRSLVEAAPLAAALGGLEERTQWILRRRFHDEWSQQEVATELGLSQMHISRLERAALRQLRAMMSDGAAEPAGSPA